MSERRLDTKNDRQTYIHTYIHSYIHTYIYKYIHTYTHAYIFIHKQTNILKQTDRQVIDCNKTCEVMCKGFKIEEMLREKKMN